MATGQKNGVIRQLRGLVLRDGAGSTDGQLLTAYLAGRDEVALATLVRRHAAMVWGVCRRVLANHHDAEDAFQATFLVLVRRAAAIASRELLANWLYGVAHQTALKARATTARRATREKQVTDMPEPISTEPVHRPDLLPVLDDELSRLPEIYRAAIVLCELEGKTRKEAARQLGVPEGTLAARLARGRAMLAKQLSRRGVVLSAGSLAGVLAPPAAAPAAMVSSTIEAATLFAVGPAGAISPAVAALTEGVLKAMLLAKLKTATLVVLVIALLGAGAVLTPSGLAGSTPEPAAADEVRKPTTEMSGVVLAADAAQNTLTLHPSKEHSEPRTLSLAAGVEVFLDDGTGDRLGFERGKPADLIEGAPVVLRLADDGKVVRVLVEGPTVYGTLKTADAAQNTITATVALTKTEPPADKTFAVARNVRLFIDEPTVDKAKPAKTLANLPAGAVVALKLSADRKTVGSIRAEGETVHGVLKAADGTKGTLTATISIKGEPDMDRVFAVAKNAAVYIDDGKPVDKTKPPGLDDLPPGARVALRLSLDGQSVVTIRAEGSTVHGTVKAVDAAKNTLTLSDKIQEEKTYNVAKDAPVFLDGKGEVKKLADLPAEAVVDLKLLADQHTVGEIRATGPTVAGTVVGTADNDSITVRDKEGDKTFAVAKGARVVIEGQKAGKLTELIDGTVAWVRLTADRSAVLEVHAEGPSFRGTIKAFDPDKQTITLLVGAKNGEGGEDKEFTLNNQTAIVTEINGVPLPRKDLRTDREVVLRLTLDQKAAGRITVLGE
jgi:RNA polymerase sigma factor (sigma-70 family)